MARILSVDHIVVSEFNTNALFTVRLSEADPLNQVTVNWNLSGLTATSGSDFTNLSGLITFNPGVVEQIISVPIINNATAEPPETFQLNLFTPSTNVQIGNSLAVATIIDNDAAPGTPVVSINDLVVDEAAREASFVITLNRPSAGIVSMNYATRNGTAISGSDYVNTSGILNFAPGETAKGVTVELVNNTSAEVTEVFDVAISSITGATIADSRGHAFIAGNDTAAVDLPALYSSNALTVEGQGYVDFLVHLSTPGTETVTINYQLISGTATTADFVKQTGTLAFAPGETVKTVRVSTFEDKTAETQETFTLQLFEAVNATLGNAVVTATILDNDSPAPALPVALNGTTAADILRGSPFADTIDGGDGDDVLDGAGGDDSLTGGAGNDTYLIEDDGDSYSETAGGGTDLVISYLSSLTLGTNVENLQLTGSAITGIGNNLNNRITGSTGSNILEGGLGSNILDGGAGTDTASYASATAGVTVDLALSGPQNTIGAGLDTLKNIENLAGSAFDDMLTGDTGNNVLQGWIGNDTFIAGLGDDELDGGAGTDTVSYAEASDDVIVTLATPGVQQNTGNAGLNTLISIENLTGSGFNDILTGNTGKNVLLGGLGSDTLEGGLGNDELDGESDTDTASYAGASAGVTVTLATPGLQQDTINAGLDTLKNIENLTGSVFNDKLTGDNGNNILDGGLGNDTLTGGLGNDTLDGGTGTDTASYADASAGLIVTLAASGIQQNTVIAGLDTLINIENLTGSDFNDILTGDTNNNRLNGGLGNDILNGGLGNDILDGGAGTDTASYADAKDDVTVTLAKPEEQQDTVNAGLDVLKNIENLTGSDFNDILTGDKSNNILLGGSGNDTLDGGLGNDRLDGESGTDTAFYAGASAGVTVTLATPGAQQNTVGAGRDTLINIENLIGSDFNDTLTGSAGNNMLQSGFGDDTLDGGLGNDRLDGRAGTDTASYAGASAGVTVTLAMPGLQQNTGNAGGLDILTNIENLIGSTFNDTLTGDTSDNVLEGRLGEDTLAGGDGNDTYLVDNIDDVVAETNAAAGGIDLVISEVDYILEKNIENLELVDYAVIGIGNSLDNRITGTVDNNVLQGGLGNDTLNGEAGTDIASYADAGAGVTVTLAKPGVQQDTVNAGLDTLINIENLTGSDFNDTLTGNAGSNVLQGGLGNDTLNGGVGNDTLDGGSGTDTASYAGASAGVTVTLATPGLQQNTVNAGRDTLMNIENLTGSGFDDNLTGNNGNNTLVGGLGDDILNGGAGINTLIGGDGSDTYFVGSLNDVVTETNADSAGGTDLVNSEIDYTLGAFIENLKLVGNAIAGIGNSLDNRITGSSGNNTLQGDLGNDKLDGEGGTDTAIYADAKAGVTVTLATPGVQQNTVSAGFDTLTNIENLSGSAFDDTLTGNAGNNVLLGKFGNDILNGDLGNDTLDGGGGTDTASYAGAKAGVTVTLARTGVQQNTINAGLDILKSVENLTGSAFGDTLTGSARNNVLQGMLGNDILSGGLGNDTLDGGAGTDTVSYADAGAGVTVTLATPGVQQDTINSDLDTLTNIENLTGSDFDDTLTGNAGNNVLRGGLDNDILNGGSGNDILDGGLGEDTASYAGAIAGVTITLATPGVQQNTVSAGLDTLKNIESLNGSKFSDTLTGNAGNNILQGGFGNDVLNGEAGSDTVDGEAENDTGIYRPSAASLGDNDSYKGNVGSDTLSLEFTHAGLNSAQVQTDLRAYEEFLALNANAAAAIGSEFQFTAFSLKASTWEQLALTDYEGLIWKGGARNVTIGTAAAQTTFQVGTNAVAPTGDIWAGAALPSGKNDWSASANWQDTSVPASTQRVVFNATDPGERSVVDPVFQGTIAGLVDTGQAAHTLEFKRDLQINGPASIHTANAQNTGSLTVFNTHINLHVIHFNVGVNSIGTGMATGYLLLNSGAVIEATDVDHVNVGTAGKGSAYGAIHLAANSTLNIGTTATPADLNIGYNYSRGPFANPVGVFDALNPAATVNWHLNELHVGRTTNGIGTASATLRWNQTEVIDANAIYFGHGGGVSSVLDVPSGGTLLLGTSADPVGLLDIADKNTGGDKTVANLDFALTNPTFTAYIGTELRIGASSNGDAEGNLKLASNSMLNLGTSAAPANLNIGYNYSASSLANPIGILDALNPAATVNWHLNELHVGRTTNGIGTASATLRWNQTEVIDANAVYFGHGGGVSSVLDVPTGGTLRLGTAADPVGLLDIADKNTGGDKTIAKLDFSLTNPTFTAYIGTELRIGASSSGSAEGALKLASNSTLNLGTSEAPANLNIGYNYSGGPIANPVGVLDALNSAATVNWHLNELYVGRTADGFGTASATLRWNQTEVIDANAIYFGRGGGVSSELDVPSGGALLLGMEADPVSLLYIADKNTGGDKSVTNLDFSLTEPTFIAHIGTELRIGASSNGSAEGALKLAPNSTLNLGATAAPANLNIGYNYSGGTIASPVGILDASDSAATVNLHLNELNVGRTTNGFGNASGILLMGDGVTGKSTAVKIGVGTGVTGLFDIIGGSLQATTLTLANGTLDLNDNPLAVGTIGTLTAQTLNLKGGLLTGENISMSGGTFNFSGGVLSVDTFNGLLDQNGGVLAPGNSVGLATINGNYDLASAGKLKIEIFGNSFDATTRQHDRLNINGTVNLNGDSKPGGGGTLDVDLGYSPDLGSKFTIIANDSTDAIDGQFKGLQEGATFISSYGSQKVTFQISYSGGNGNDVVLTVTNKSGTAPAGLTVNGTAGSDLLSGGIGSDKLTGQAGNDILTGSTGNDLFSFGVNCGSDRINDFSPGSDVIQLDTALGVSNFTTLDTNSNSILDDADSHVIVAGNDTILMFGSDQIDIVGQAALQSSDFLFV